MGGSGPPGPNFYAIPDIYLEKKQNMREKGKISHRDTSDNIGDANKILVDRELVSRS